MRYILAVLLPPLAVLMCGKPFQFILNIFLTLLLWLPGRSTPSWSSTRGSTNGAWKSWPLSLASLGKSRYGTPKTPSGRGSRGLLESSGRCCCHHDTMGNDASRSDLVAAAD